MSLRGLFYICLLCRVKYMQLHIMRALSWVCDGKSRAVMPASLSILQIHQAVVWSPFFPCGSLPLEGFTAPPVSLVSRPGGGRWS